MSKRSTTEAINDLRELLIPGERVYYIIRHVSQSGMMRVLDLYVMRDNAPRRITHTAALALDWTYNRKHEGVQVNGCGMDMAWHIVYSLASTVFRGYESPALDAWVAKRSQHTWQNNDVAYALDAERI